MLSPLDIVHCLSVVSAILVLTGPAFVVEEFPNGERTYVSWDTPTSITSETYGPPLICFGRANLYVVYAMLIIGRQITATVSESTTRAYLGTLTVLALVLIVLSWGRSTSANQQTVKGIAAVRLSHTYLVGVATTVFTPSCHAIGWIATKMRMEAKAE
jgi:hypothetical protein